MALSSPSTYTPNSDLSLLDGLSQLQLLYRVASASSLNDELGNMEDAGDVDLIKEDPLLSISNTSGMVGPTMLEKPIEDSLVGKLLQVQPPGKSVDLLGSRGGPGLAVVDPVSLAGFDAAGYSF